MRRRERLVRTAADPYMKVVRGPSSRRSGWRFFASPFFVSLFFAVADLCTELPPSVWSSAGLCCVTLLAATGVELFALRRFWSDFDRLFQSALTITASFLAPGGITLLFTAVLRAPARACPITQSSTALATRSPN